MAATTGNPIRNSQNTASVEMWKGLHRKPQGDEMQSNSYMFPLWQNVYLLDVYTLCNTEMSCHVTLDFATITGNAFCPAIS